MLLSNNTIKDQWVTGVIGLGSRRGASDSVTDSTVHSNPDGA